MKPSSPETTALHVVAPVYNEADNIGPFVEAIEGSIPKPFTLWIVYDFDEDTTLPPARELAKSRPWLKLLRNDLGRGVVNALRAGFNAVDEGPVLVTMADLSDDLSIVPRMLELYAEGYRVVCPSRYMRGGRQIGGPLVKRALSQAAGLSLRYVAGLPTHDATNNFRLYDAALVRELGIESLGGFEVALELTTKAFMRGVPIAEVPSTWRDRTAGQSNFKLRKWLPHYTRWFMQAMSTGLSRRVTNTMAYAKAARGG